MKGIVYLDFGHKFIYMSQILGARIFKTGVYKKYMRILKIQATTKLAIEMDFE